MIDLSAIAGMVERAYPRREGFALDNLPLDADDFPEFPGGRERWIVFRTSPAGQHEANLRMAHLITMLEGEKVATDKVKVVRQEGGDRPGIRRPIDLLGISPSDPEVSKALNESVAAGRRERDRDFIEACASVRRLLDDRDRMAAARPKPHVVDTFGGFLIELDGSENERRCLEVVVEGGCIETTYRIDGRPVRSTNVREWSYAADFIERFGDLSLACYRDGFPLSLRINGDWLELLDGECEPVVALNFHPIKGSDGVVQLRFVDGLRSDRVSCIDWLDAEARLTSRGILVRAERIRSPAC